MSARLSGSVMLASFAREKISASMTSPQRASSSLRPLHRQQPRASMSACRPNLQQRRYTVQQLIAQLDLVNVLNDQDDLEVAPLNEDTRRYFEEEGLTSALK